uniref:Reverse transcriptase n=1 Tax=Phytophthora ramorum TaxID=164328 RepID=H3H673_PHYRM
MENVFGQDVTVQACIIEGCDEEFLLGVDFLRGHKAMMDFENNEVRYVGKGGAVVIPFRTFATHGHVMLATTVTEAKDGKAWVPVINVTGSRTKLLPRSELGTWVPLDADMQVLAVNGELSRERLRRPLPDTEVVEGYRQVSNNQGDCPPATTLDVEHHIDTGIEAPVMLKRRRHAQMEDTVIDDNVKTMLQAGVIEEGNGAWGFPVVLVRKKDGEFTTLDLRAGYWQIRVADRDKDKTAFTTKKGLYRFVRMPFGLMNAPSTFQRMMNGVLRGLTWATCLVYLDDIVVFTRGGIERHIVELASVLERLSVADLTLKLKKCVFAAQTMEYLGHELNCDGVRPVERLITAVREFPRPRDPVEVKRFVHLAGYYRKFIEGFGSIMAPLTSLLRKTIEWRWTEAQEFAYERMKFILTEKPLLIYPNFQLPFRLVTDASKVGLGACLMQDAGSGWQPVAYASKVNSSAEANYSITELECLAVVWSIKLFRPYLYGRPFAIVTDHSALKWLMTRQNPAGRLHRWSLTLQEYDFEIEYRPGSTNVVADALSRAPAAVKAAVGGRPSPGVQEELVNRNVDQAVEAALAALRDDSAQSSTNNAEKDGGSGATKGAVPATGPDTTRPVTRAAKRRAEEEARQAVVEQATEPAMVSGESGDTRQTPVEPAGRPKPCGNGRVISRTTRKPAERRSPVRKDAVTLERPGIEVPPRAQTAEEPTNQQGTDGGGASDDANDIVELNLQLTDNEIMTAQHNSKMVQRLSGEGQFRGQKVETAYGLVIIHTEAGRRVVLPPALWPVVFKECHDSVWAGHLRGPHTYARIARLYWWPGMQKEVRRWVRGCQECGSRKACPREVIPTLRSLRGGDVGDRWALDVAGPFPVAAGGERYVIAAVEYVTRYAVATSVTQHTAENVAAFLMKEVVLRFGPFRELLTDGAPELTGKAIEQLIVLLQANQINPVPYRPQMIGLVERFHRTWKDCVAMYMADERQNDWEMWVRFAVYAYNSARHSTVALTPNELMGRKLRAPGVLMRQTEVSEAGELLNYHRELLRSMERNREWAERARVKEQARQAKYYNRKAKRGREFHVGDRVWLFRPPRGPKATKFVHPWMGPLRIIEPAGYDNFVVRREDKTGDQEEFIAHSSFLTTYHQSAEWLVQAARDLAAQLDDESLAAEGNDGEAGRASIRAEAAPVNTAAARQSTKRGRKTVEPASWLNSSDTRVVEGRRRRRRNRAGQYILEYEVWRFPELPNSDKSADKRWVSVSEYEELYVSGRIVEDPRREEGV